MDLKPCPVCKNTDIQIGVCTYEGKTVAFNVYCPICNFTGRSYRMRVKALDKWNKLCEQTKTIYVR